MHPISMITFRFSAMARDKEVKGVARQRDKENGGEEGRVVEVGFVLDGEFTRSVSVLPITPIRH